MSTVHHNPAASILLFKQTVASAAPAIMDAANLLGTVFDRVIPPPGVKTGKRDIKVAPRKGGSTKQRMKGLRP